MEVVHCEGAPRALGLDQGAACASAIRVWLASRGLPARPRRLPTLRRLTGGPVLGAGVGREVVRHFPHLVERMSGIARAARVPLESLMEDVVASAYRDPAHPLARGAIGCGARTSAGAVLVRELAPAAPWTLRRSRPEVGFASIEVTLPWLAGSVAGVNEAGVAALAAAPATGRLERGLGAPPAWLLVQTCLQRFDGLDAALDWCLRRPAAGECALVLSDGTGELAVVEFSDSGAVLRERGGASVVAGGTPAGEAALRKRLTDGRALAADEATPIEGLAPGAAQVRLRPEARALEWREPGRPPERLPASAA